MRILITGIAGFIGFHATRQLTAAGNEVVGIDNINNYNNEGLKPARLAHLGINTGGLQYGQSTANADGNIRFIKLDISDRELLPMVFGQYHFDAVLNLAAQANTRQSISNPFVYVDSNVGGFINVLECCRNAGVPHVVYASSSSVYGDIATPPFVENDSTDNQRNLYAVTKKTNELMADCYSRLYGMRLTGLRFFSVYGPWGRPDMAPMIFAKAICSGEPLMVFNNGNMQRDFTYIDDVVESIFRILTYTHHPYSRLHNIYNVGCSQPVNLLAFIAELERTFGRTAQKQLLPMQPGDVPATSADASALEHDYGYRPQTQLSAGVLKFVEWYKSYFNI